MASTEKVNLVNGPSREALVDGLKYAYDRNHPHEVIFTTEGGIEYSVTIKSLMHDDGSGHSFFLTGLIKSQAHGKLRTNIGRHSGVKGFFNTRSRSGSMEIVLV